MDLFSVDHAGQIEQGSNYCPTAGNDLVSLIHSFLLKKFAFLDLKNFIDNH